MTMKNEASLYSPQSNIELLSESIRVDFRKLSFDHEGKFL